MSVVVKGIEMPKGCAFCKIKRRNGDKMVCPLCNEEWSIHDHMSADFRLGLCPLIPADVADRKRGKWREDMWLTTEGYSCSECNCFTKNPSMFCPDCGADMREPPKEVGT